MFTDFITDSCKNLMSNKLVVVSDVSNDHGRGILTMSLNHPSIYQLTRINIDCSLHCPLQTQTHQRAQKAKRKKRKKSDAR